MTGGRRAEIAVLGWLAEELDSCFSLSMDMDLVLAYLKNVLPGLTAIERGRFDLIFASQGQWHAAVVTYARCFAAGARKGAAERAAIPPDLRGTHNDVLEYRRNFAHVPRRPSAGRAAVRLVIDERALVRLHVEYSEGFATPDPAMVDGLSRLAQALHDQFMERSRAADRRILEVASSMDETVLWRMADRKVPLRLDHPPPP